MDRNQIAGLGIVLGIVLLFLAAIIVRSSRKSKRLDKAILAVIAEQQRRERLAIVPYRVDQRERAMQQRLTRILGTKQAKTLKVPNALE